jgi:hypothetical protein
MSSIGRTSDGGEWTGRLIVKRTRVLQPSPGMEPTRRQSQEPQEGPQRNKRTGPIHGAQDPDLGRSVGQTLVRQRESRASKQGEGEPKECRELLDAAPQLQNLLSELRLSEVRTIQTDHDRWRGAKPPTRRRARDSAVRGDCDVPGALNEIPKPVVVALLRAGRGRHGDDHRPFSHAAQLLEDD